MSSILEALKKLEAEKNAQLAPVEEPPSYEVDYTAGGLLGNINYGGGARSRTNPIALVLAGGFFAVLVIAVSVLLAMVLLQRVQTPNVATSQPPASPPPPAAVQVPAVAVAANTTEEPAELMANFAEDATKAVDLPIVEEESRPAPPPPSPPRERVVRTPVIPVATEVRYEPYIPKAEAEDVPKSQPVPKDIRSLPMLTRSEREQYRLENVALNMLNEANALRPTGNAIINLEKVFVGETLPGSNAKLLEVQSHGIAVEIMSTHQRYYIPR